MKTTIKREYIDTELFGDEPVFELNVGDVFTNCFLFILMYIISITMVVTFTAPFWAGDKYYSRVVPENKFEITIEE